MGGIRIVPSIDSDKAGSIFLATTALEEFWDTSIPIVFLGEWCCRFSRRDYWKPLEGQIMETPWSDSQKIVQAYDYVNELYERLLPLLADAMNRLHGVHHGVRYWRILLGPWLLIYLPSVYDRYVCLQKALKYYPNLTTTVLAEESWVTPVDTMEFVQLLKEDPYNLQIYSRLLTLMGKEHSSQNMQIMSTPLYATNPIKLKIKSAVGSCIRLASNVIARLHQNKIVFTQSPYFSKKITVKLFMKSGFCVLPLFGVTGGSKHPIEIVERNTILESSWATNDFERLLNNMLSMDIPKSYIERFKTTKNIVDQNYPKKTAAILTANCWYYDEAFKQWAAGLSENGTQLLGVQHGGNYGSLFFHPSVNHEIAVTDRYYTWGWTRENSETGTIVPMPAAKLIGRNQICADNQKKGILYIATSASKYLSAFSNIPRQFKEYLEWQSLFVKHISPLIIQGMRVRLHREDLGWDIAEQWNTFYPEIPKEGWDMPLESSIKNCRMYISDNLNTTFKEGLAVNKPGVLFWNPLYTPLRPEAEPYYDKLREVGILHDTPESAAKAVNEIYADVETWWNEPHRQAVRRNFCERFARTSPNAVDEWVAEFKRVTKSN